MLSSWSCWCDTAAACAAVEVLLGRASVLPQLDILVGQLLLLKPPPSSAFRLSKLLPDLYRSK
jgi:hypothetical protein